MQKIIIIKLDGKGWEEAWIVQRNDYLKSNVNVTLCQTAAVARQKNNKTQNKTTTTTTRLQLHIREPH
jgi:hypothetical protein